MKNLLIVGGVLVLLLIGGGLTAQLMSQGDASLLAPVLLQKTEIPDASTLAMAPWQAEQLVILVGFILFNLVGIAVTIAVIMWFLHRGVKSAEAEETAVVTSQTSKELS